MEHAPVITCCWLPSFALRVVAHGQASLERPVALACDAQAHPIVLDCSDAARADGVTPGMLVTRALGCCAQLEVLSCDVARVEAAGERFLRRLESIGAAVQPIQPGRACFDAAPLELLYGGLTQVFDRALCAFDGGQVRIGAGPNPFVAWVAARHAPPGSWLCVQQSEVRQVLGRMPLTLLPASDELQRLLQALGLSTLDDLAALDVHQVADRLGAEGVRLRALARGEDAARLDPRVPSEPVVERLTFAEPVANEQTLEQALRLLADRLVLHPRCVQHAPRAVVVTGQLAAGRSWQARRVLRAPTVDARRIVLAIAPAFGELPAPVEHLELQLDGFAPRGTDQLQLLDGEGGRSGGLVDARVQRGMQHVQEALGELSLLQVLEVEPWSRVPERHAVLVPRRVGAV